MASPRPPSLAQAPHDRLPELLHDIRLLDLLELRGTTVQIGRLWGCGDGPSATGPLATGPRLPVPTVRELGRMGGPRQLEG